MVVPKERAEPLRSEPELSEPVQPDHDHRIRSAGGRVHDLAIYNVNGQLVQTFTGNAEAGFQSVTWDASNVASGMYLYKLTAGSFTSTRKMLLVK